MLETISKVILCTIMNKHDWSRIRLDNTLQYRCQRCGLHINKQFVDLYDEAKDVYDDFSNGSVIGGIDTDDSSITVTVSGSVNSDTIDQTESSGNSGVQVLNSDTNKYSDPCEVLREVEKGNISTVIYDMTDTQQSVLMCILSVECDALENGGKAQIHRPTDYHARYDTFDALVRYGFLAKIDDTQDSTAQYVLTLPDEEL